MKQFNPDYEYRFWFWRHKFEMVLEMIALLIDYDFMDGEMEGMRLDLDKTDNTKVDKWSGGLHYGKKDVVYMKLAQDIENKDIIYVFISTHKELKERIEFIDLLQEHYKWFQNNEKDG
jgi:3'-phosphoadenosine 5'-phosphosulfate sulfotransferase (PAPS reductase)/FAD synthetase